MMPPRALIIGTFITLVLWVLVLRPPFAPVSATVTIPQGASVGEIGTSLKQAHVVVSADTYSLLARLFDGARFGTYRFDSGESVIEVAWRIAHADTGLPLVRVTIPEGSSVSEIEDILIVSLPGFNRTAFVHLAAGDQGHLFPDTYFFTAGESASGIIATMRANFDTHIAPLLPAIATSTHNEAAIVSMAAILEKEVRGTDQPIVADILWKRLDAGMRLQVDAAPITYDMGGLPPPIANPGLAALNAALYPISSKYWYYLTGSDGTVHYAVTFAEHTANRKYLK